MSIIFYQITQRGGVMKFRVEAIKEKDRQRCGSRCERVGHEKVTEATLVAVCGGFRITTCADEVCKAKAIHLATSFARAKKDTDQWSKNPRKMARDIKKVLERM